MTKTQAQPFSQFGWKESDLAMMIPKERERYERFFTKRKAKIYFNEA